MFAKLFRSLLRKQEQIDRQSFFIKDKSYDELAASDIVRHDLFHLIKLVAKIAHYCDKDDHNLEPSYEILKNEVIPDLLIYSLQLSNALQVDIHKSYEKRLEYVLNKFNHSEYKKI